MKKNYIKLIGSIICALSVIIMVGTIAIGAQADDKKIEFVEGVTYTADNTIPTAPEGYSEEDGYLFAGWYVADKSDSVDGYSPEREPVVGTKYYAKYVPSEVLGLKAQISAQIKNNDTDKIQNSSVDNAIRFVTSLDSTEYNHIGFNIKIAGTSYDQDAAVSKSVYTQIYGIGAEKDKVITYTPDTEFHSVSKYVKTYTFTTIPEAAFDSDIKVTPYWITLDGTRVDGPETVVKTVNYCRAWVYVDDSENAVTNEAAPVGTSSNPYSDLQTALDVDGQTLVPKVILKSDYEYTGTTVATAKQSLTLASVKDDEGNAKKIIRNDTNTSRLLKVNVTDGTVNLEDITLDGNQKSGCVEVTAGNLSMKAGSTITKGGNVDAGANVIVQASTTLTMEEGSTISSGTAKKQGGNILTSGALTIKGGVISDGKAIASKGENNYGSGGNIHGYGASTITVESGSILRGEASSSYYNKGALGGNICSTGNIYIKGGIISGGQAVSEYEVTGDETNTYIRCHGGNFYCESGNELVITGGTISDGEAEYGGNISATCNITVSDEANISGGTATYGGSLYYKTRELTVSGGTISGGTATATTTTQTGLGGNVYVADGTLALSGGTISGGTATTNTHTAYTGLGGNVYTAEGATLNITSGTITLGTAQQTFATTTTDTTVSYEGCGGNIYNEGTLTINGGTISTGTASTSQAIYRTGCGGNIFSTQSITIDGSDTVGTENAVLITSGNANYTAANNNYALGGNIIMVGESAITLDVKNATIEKGYAKGRGGNINLNANATLNLTNATITEGKTGGNGGNIFAQGSSVVTVNDGGVISAGEAASGNGGNIIFNNAGKKLTLKSGSQLLKGNAKAGGSIYILAGTLELQGGTISGGTATNNGGNIYNEKGTIDMVSGGISGGTATNNGGNIYLHAAMTTATNGTAGSMTFNNGLISGGKAKLGGNIYLNRVNGTYSEKEYTTPATMEMNGGTIENGWATAAANVGGGNIYCFGKFTMDAGSISGGVAGASNVTAARGGNIYAHGVSGAKYAGEVIINAGGITDGRATGRGGNIHLAHSYMTLGSGLIEISGGELATVAADGTTTVKNSTAFDNVSMFAASVPNITILSTLNLVNPIGFSSSNTGEFANFTETCTQEIATLFTNEQSGYEIVLSSDGKALTYSEEATE